LPALGKFLRRTSNPGTRDDKLITVLRPLQETLNAQGNSFEGTLPEFLFNLTSLQSLDLGGNSFTGEIPMSISRLSNLGKCAAGIAEDCRRWKSLFLLTLNRSKPLP
jgi:hypothetical protein